MSAATGGAAILQVELCELQGRPTTHAEGYTHDLAQAFRQAAADSFGKQQGTVLKSTAASLLARFSQADPAFFAAIKILKSGIGANTLLRAGLHFGQDEEAPTVASNICRLAGAGEILVTGDTLPYLCRHFREQCSTMPSVAVPGRPNLDIYACKKLAGEETLIGLPETAAVPSTRTSFLLLVQDGREVMVTPDSVPLSIGRASDCDITLTGNRCSRFHAHIELQNNNYILRDQSSNGTVMIKPPRDLVAIHREAQALEGTGTLLFGGRSSDQAEDVLEFTVVDSPLN